MKRVILLITFCYLLLSYSIVSSQEYYHIEWIPPYPRVVASNIELQWKKNNAIDEYAVFCNANKITQIINTGNEAESSRYGLYIDEQKIVGNYTYVIVGLADGKEIAKSNPKTIEIVLNQSGLPSPYDLIGRLDRGRVSLNWAVKTSGQENFKIYRKIDLESEYKLIATLPKYVNKYWDTSIQAGHKYFYAVAGEDKYGNESQKSNVYEIEYKLLDVVEEETELAYEIKTELIDIIYPVDEEGNSYDEDKPGGNIKGIDVNSDKEVFITELQQKEVEIFSGRGKLLSRYKAEDIPLTLPMSVCVADNGDSFILDSEKKMILAVNKRGGLLGEFSIIPSNKKLRYPVGATKMGIDRKNKILFVSDTGNSTIYLYDFKGAYRGSMGDYGHKNGQFSAPGKVWVDKAGNIYVVDTLNCRIQVFDKDRKIKFSFGGQGDNALGTFSRPCAVVVNSAGKIYVLDRLQQIIQVFNNDCTPIGVIRRPDGKNFLLSPFDLTLDKEDNLYVCDAGNRRVIVFKDVE
ncbi:MAG: hypothetical protein V1872_05820 [bacterium]